MPYQAASAVLICLFECLLQCLATSPCTRSSFQIFNCTHRQHHDVRHGRLEEIRGEEGRLTGSEIPYPVFCEELGGGNTEGKIVTAGLGAGPVHQNKSLILEIFRL